MVRRTATLKPGRDGLNVFNVRAYTAPFPRRADLSFEFEYASERNGDALDSNAWTLQGAYELSDVTWKPKLSYRYAFFQGDDPATPANEAFDPLFLGFSRLGHLVAGRDRGEYFLSNSNLTSHQIRAHVTPSEAVGGGLIFYKFRLDQPGVVRAGRDATGRRDRDGRVHRLEESTRTSPSAWSAPTPNPGKAVQQATGRTKNFTYGMVYIAYSF